MSTTRAYIEELSRAECRSLLPQSPVGWIAHCSAGSPQLVPVNYVVHGNEVVVRTGYGSKLAAAAHGLVMSLGVDSIDPATCTGWSVTVTGPARVIGDEDEVAVLDLPPWRCGHPGTRRPTSASRCGRSPAGASGCPPTTGGRPGDTPAMTAPPGLQACISSLSVARG